MLRAILKAPARAQSGEPVPLVFAVTNTGRTSVTLQLLGRVPTADFRVADRDGRLVWSRLRGQTLLGPRRLFPLAAGESLSFRRIWDQRTDAGAVRENARRAREFRAMSEADIAELRARIEPRARLELEWYKR